jgi:hypothetical protein
MRPSTYPLAHKAKTVLRGAGWLLCGILWFIGAGLCTAAVVAMCMFNPQLYTPEDVQAKIEAAKEAELVEACGGPEAVPVPLLNGDTQCYTHRGKKTTLIKKEKVK